MTELAPALAMLPKGAEPAAPQVEYGPPVFARPSFTHGFASSAFALQADGPYAVLLIIPSIHKNDGPSAMALCRFSTLLAWGIAARVRFVPSVKKAMRAKNLGG
jgi:hypothetical protein